MSEGPSIPTEVVVIVMAEGRPLDGGWATLTVEMSTKNDFHLLIGPAGADGVIRVARSAILADCDRQRSFFLMEYADPRTAWSGGMSAEAMDGPAIERALAAYQLYDGDLYPGDFLIAMGSLADVVRPISSAALTAQLT